MNSRPEKRDTKRGVLNRAIFQSRDLLSRLPKYQCSAFVLGAILLITPAFISCRPAPKQRLRIGTNINPGYECLYLARNLGYQHDLNVRLVEFPSASCVIRAFRNQLIDAAALTMDEALLLASQGHAPKVVLIMNFSHGGNVILAQPDISSFRELKAKRIGVESTAMGAYVLSRAIEMGGLQPEDIAIVPLEASEHEEAFLNKQVDALVTTEPTRSRLLRKGARQLFDSSLIPNDIVEVLVVREEALQTYRPELAGITASWFKATEHLHNHFALDANEMAPRTGMDPADLLLSLRSLNTPDLQENKRLLSRQDAGFTRRLTTLAKTMAQHELLPGAVDPLTLLSDELFQEGTE